MKKCSLINIAQDFDISFQEDDIITFEMPSFCSGDYVAVVCKDPDFGLYIDAEDNYFDDCRDFSIIRDGKII